MANQSYSAVYPHYHFAALLYPALPHIFKSDDRMHFQMDLYFLLYGYNTKSILWLFDDQYKQPQFTCQQGGNCISNQKNQQIFNLRRQKPSVQGKLIPGEASSELWLSHTGKGKHIVVLLLQRKRASACQISTSQQVFSTLLSLQTIKDCKDGAVMVWYCLCQGILEETKKVLKISHYHVCLLRVLNEERHCKIP